jgi:hypothetical protein
MQPLYVFSPAIKRVPQTRDVLLLGSRASWFGQTAMTGRVLLCTGDEEYVDL